MPDLQTPIAPVLPNYVGGHWVEPTTQILIDVVNPATADVLACVPLSSAPDTAQAIAAAAQAFPNWRKVPVTRRIQYLFHLKALLEQHLEEIATTITLECGKTLNESRGELRRAIENVEVACGAPMLSQGQTSEDIARGIDELMFRQPLGVTAIIAPFNFPGMIPFWFLPYAIACGNTCVIKPSEQVPLTLNKVMHLIAELGLPAGVVNLVNGAKEAVDTLLDHPAVKAISFVGSTPVARYVYSRATANGKRAQCQGGAKNPVIIMPDADLELTTRIVADSAFGCAGQRCLAASIAITVGSAYQSFTDAIGSVAQSRNVGFGLDPEVEMGPVINAQSQSRIEALIREGITDGAQLLVDGRNAQISGYEQGHFVRPTVLDQVKPQSNIAQTEIFGPV
ncbi:MAG: aldehyde dehydrogenase family protein, partial [Cyanobacteria bacterium P01_H01_bin.121]